MKDEIPGSLEVFVQALPKTETHLHIEGAVPYHELVRTVDPVRFGPDPEWRRRSFRYDTFPQFESILLDHAMAWYTSPERYYESARHIFAGQVLQNVRYSELSFHLHMAEHIKAPGQEIVAAIRAAVPPGLEVRIFVGMLRNAYQGPLRAVIDDLGNWSGLAGIDLHGLETPNEPWTAGVWERARRAGKVVKAHAGECDGAARVREAIEVLGVRRIQHGVRAIEDPAVLQLAVDVGATFDVCPLSNVGLRVVPSIAAHPLRDLMAAGVNCTVSTDDPLSFNNTLTDEYLALAREGGFSRAELAQVARAGWKVADVPAAERRKYLAEIDRLAAAGG
jgi:adenosine deaminase